MGYCSFDNENMLAENLNTKSYEELRDDVRNLRKNGFVPLNPMFDESDAVAEQEYLSRRAKKAKKLAFFIQIRPLTRKVRI